jgi:hypothetical protein
MLVPQFIVEECRDAESLRIAVEVAEVERCAVRGPRFIVLHPLLIPLRKPVLDRLFAEVPKWRVADVVEQAGVTDYDLEALPLGLFCEPLRNQARRHSPRKSFSNVRHFKRVCEPVANGRVWFQWEDLCLLDHVSKRA